MFPVREAEKQRGVDRLLNATEGLDDPHARHDLKQRLAKRSFVKSLRTLCPLG